MDLQDLNNLDLSDIDINNMGGWPVAGKAFVAVIVFSLVAFLGYYAIIGDQTEQLLQIERKEVDLKKEFEKKQAKAVNLDDYKRQMKTIQESFKTLLQQLPKSSELPSLLDDLSYAATGAGCEVESAEFLDEKNSEFYKEKPIAIVVKGGYHQIAEFVSRISRLSRIVTLHDFEITIGDGDVPSSPGEKLLIMSITAKTYRSDSEEE
jgi:type IV pilus assembly protein PilO